MEKVLLNSKSLTYNAIKSTIEMTDHNRQLLDAVNDLRVSYEESKLIKERLIQYVNEEGINLN